MRPSKQIVLRLDAGMKFGLGHLSRCYTVSQEFKTYSKIFIIKTDNEEVITNFFSCKRDTSCVFITIKENINEDEEFKLINRKLENNGFLVLDHYTISDSFQKKLLQSNIKWLQFDSHAKIKLWANWVLHGSPAATFNLYEQLVKNKKTTLLLGTRFSIIKKEIRSIRKEVKVRNKLQKILICFGGGDDRGLTLAVLKQFLKDDLKKFTIRVCLNSKNKTFGQVKLLLEKTDNFIVPQQQLANEMKNADVGFFAPGMISYEAACLGLPMILVPFASNQLINSKGWEEAGCAFNMKGIDKITKPKLKQILTKLENDSQRIKNMSIKCMEMVDGKGAWRVQQIIEESI